MPALDIARGVAFAAIALTSGTVAFAALVWLPALREQFGQVDAARADGGAATRGGSISPGAVAAAALASLMLFSAGVGLAAALIVLAAGDLLGTRGQLGWALGAAAFLLIAGLAWRVRRTPAPAPPAPAAWLVAAAALTVVPGLAGNAGGEHPAAVLVSASALHVAAASVWAGGIACLLLAVPAGLAALPAASRSAQLAVIASRFSAVALVAVVVLALSGVVQGLALVGRIDALATTGYGRLVLVKGALLCVLALAGALHRGRVLPALRAAADEGAAPGAAAAAFRRLLGGEALLLTAVFAATAALAATTPAADRPGEDSVSARGALGAAAVEVVARPGRPGDNRLTITVSGAAAQRLEQLAVSARQRRLGLGPEVLVARRTAPGRFTVDEASLPGPGTWELTLTAQGATPARLALRLR